MTELYVASQIKRSRSTQDEVMERRSRLYTIVSEMRPMTVRQVFYQATVRGVVEKSEAGYAKVQTDLAWLRRRNIMPYNWLADNTRWQRKPRTFDSIQQALDDTAQFYRKALWTDAGAYVEVWLEKDALAGVVQPITAELTTDEAESIASLCSRYVNGLLRPCTPVGILWRQSQVRFSSR